MSLRLTDAASLALVALALFAGLAAVPALPAEFAIHFPADGTPTTTVPTVLGVLLVPLVAAAVFLWLRGSAVRPELSRRAGPAGGFATVAGTASLQGALLALNFGVDVSPLVLVAPGVLLIVGGSVVSGR